MLKVKVKSLWHKIGSFLREVIVCVTFLALFPLFVSTLYFALVDYNPVRCVVSVVVFYIMLLANTKL